MKLTLTIQSDSGQHAPARRALGFLRAAEAAGHGISQVFFYGEGVRSALEPDIQKDWQGVATVAELVLCSASADRLGIKSAPAGFEIAGLGALVASGAGCERVVNFV